MNPNSDTSLSTSPAGSTNKSLKPIILIVGLLALASVIWYAKSPSKKPETTVSSSKESAAKEENKPIPVAVQPVIEEKFDVTLSALGTVSPVNTVEVHSRVDGQILSINFKEGQIVKAGDLLAQIDPKPFEVQVALATGQLARDQALLDNAKVDLERYHTLLAQDSISRQLVDTQETLVSQHKAALQAAQGAIDNAKLQLSYTKITAPISGRVGLRQIGPGNLIRATEGNGIVMITQLQPMNVVFTAPEDNLPTIMKLLKSEHVSVKAYDRGQETQLGSGKLLAADNQIDPATGTIKLKAEFSNADGALFANQFVNIKMPIKTLYNAKLIPTAAIQRGTVGTFLYVVKADKTVTVTPIKIVSSQGDTSAIEGDVKVGNMVVVDGADRLREGIQVETVVRDTPQKSGRDKVSTNTSKKNTSHS